MTAISFSPIINHINPELSTGLSRSEDGVEYYYGFEEIKDDNFPFWYAYGKTSLLVAEACNSLCDNAADNFDLPPYPNGFSKALHCDTEEKWRSHIQFIREKGWRQHKKGNGPGSPFGSAGLNDGIGAMIYVLDGHQERLEKRNYGIRECVNNDRKIFMVYLSRVPIEKRHVAHENLRELSKLPQYSDKFGHIVMSFVCQIDATSSKTRHGGIFRNPLSFLNRDERYKGISMQLHGFGAAVAQSRFEGKTHMWVTPIRSMGLIMYKHLGPNRVQIDNHPVGTSFREDEFPRHFNVIVSLEELAKCYFRDSSTPKKAEFV